MAQSTREVGKGQRKGRNATVVVSPLLQCSSPSASVPSAASAASNAEKNIVVARQQAQENKYPLWKYVTRHQEPRAKLMGEGMFFGHVVSAILSLRAPTTELRAICWANLVDLDHVNQ
jgi:hypothetical protein